MSLPSIVAITGSSGLIGTQVRQSLSGRGVEVRALVRRPAVGNEIRWYPEQGVLPEGLLEGVEAVVNLCGENIASGRWTSRRKQKIRDSRIVSTRLLAETLARMKSPPTTMVSASAIGFYGDRGDPPLEEDAPAGSGFLADVCREWEEATEPAAAAGIRVVRLRIGIVLSTAGGALQKMLLPFRLGGGGIVGSGQQYWSWITLDDLVNALVHCLTDATLQGPVNAVSPNAVTNRVFTKALGRALHRPTILPMPAWAARLALGEMAEALLLASARVVPRKLTDAGFPFRHNEIESALQSCISATRSTPT